VDDVLRRHPATASGDGKPAGEEADRLMPELAEVEKTLEVAADPAEHEPD